METIGDRIKKALALRGISGNELSRRCGWTDSIVNTVVKRFEGNPKSDVAVETILAIAKGLNVPLVWLVTGAGSPDEDTQTSASTAPDDAPHINASVPGWDDAVALARVLAPDLPDAAFERASRAARFLTTAHASPELVVQLARTALQFGGRDMLDAIRAEGLARQEARRERVDLGVERSSRAPLTEEGQKAVADGRLIDQPRDTYKGAGANTKPANDRKK